MTEEEDKKTLKELINKLRGAENSKPRAYRKSDAQIKEIAQEMLNVRKRQEAKKQDKK